MAAAFTNRRRFNNGVGADVTPVDRVLENRTDQRLQFFWKTRLTHQTRPQLAAGWQSDSAGALMGNNGSDTIVRIVVLQNFRGLGSVKTSPCVLFKE